MARYHQGWILAAFAQRPEMYCRIVQDQDVEDVGRAVGAADLGPDVLIWAVGDEVGRCDDDGFAGGECHVASRVDDWHWCRKRSRGVARNLDSG